MTDFEWDSYGWLKQFQKQMFNIDPLIKDILNIVKMNDSIKIAGSSSDINQNYWGDIDAFNPIKIERKDFKNVYENFFEKFSKIMSDILNMENVFFIELKIQDLNRNKHRYYSNDAINKKIVLEQLKNNDFVKIDLILYLENRNEFVDFSVIYKINPEDENDPIYNFNMEKMIIKDIKEYKNENPFKALKRLYLLAKLRMDRNMLNTILKILNSELGLIYKKRSQLETFISLLENHPEIKEEMNTTLTHYIKEYDDILKVFPTSKLIAIKKEMEQLKKQGSNLSIMKKAINKLSSILKKETKQFQELFKYADKKI